MPFNTSRRFKIGRGEERDSFARNRVPNKDKSLITTAVAVAIGAVEITKANLASFKQLRVTTVDCKGTYRAYAGRRPEESQR
jgi:alkylhydroperoxidase/carboxymuconolactone decarboxylase family protein YurZ